MKGTNDKPNPWAALFETALAAPRSWIPLLSAHAENIGWALDVAEAAAVEIEESVGSVRRVRGFLQARLAGFALHWSLLDHTDLMRTAALFLHAIERDLGPARGRTLTLHNVDDTRELGEFRIERLFEGIKRREAKTAQKETSS